MFVSLQEPSEHLVSLGPGKVNSHTTAVGYSGMEVYQFTLLANYPSVQFLVLVLVLILNY